MELGAFSISLTVKDIEQSKLFYQKLGFEVIGGDQSEHWLILKNGQHKIGLFQGMFDKNMLTFNPGWDQERNKLTEFADVRKLLAEFKQQGVNVVHESINGERGPSSFIIEDPDGNPILIDQHI